MQTSTLLSCKVRGLLINVDFDDDRKEVFINTKKGSLLSIQFEPDSAHFSGLILAGSSHVSSVQS